MSQEVKKDILQSQNFQGSASAILIFILWGVFELLGGLGLDLEGKQDLAVVLADAIVNVDIIKIVTVASPSIIVPLLKLNQNGGLSFANLKLAWKRSTNFKKDVAIFLSAVAATLGIIQIDFDFLMQLFNEGFSIGSIVTLAIALTQFIVSSVKINKATKEAKA